MRRTKGPVPPVAPDAEPWKDKSLTPLWMDTRKFPAVAERAARAMQIGGATLEDIRTVYGVLRAQSVMHLIDYENAQLADRRRRQTRALDAVNAGKVVTAEERKEVAALDAILRKSYPVKSHRYDAIDAQRNYRRGRARYILEGPRKRKKNK